jgi:hypothetical protein
MSRNASAAVIKAASRCSCLGVVAVLVVVISAALAACRPVPQSYYDWLAAGGGYYDGYAPLFHGHFINRCPLHEVIPRECRVHDPSAMLGASSLGVGGSSLTSSLKAHGFTRGSSTGMTGQSGGHVSAGHASHGGHAGGGHGGHGGR